MKFLFDKDNFYLFILFIFALILRIVVANMDPYLYEWDERYHALVAKNLINNPLTPMLRIDPILPLDYKSWWNNHIWLHKQPLFLWQMALSMKIFGVNIFSLRLPSAVMGALLVYPSFYIGKICVNKVTGYVLAILMATAFYQIELASGAFGMEHNDLAFLFYTSLSLFAYIKFKENNTIKWAIITGVFCGAAVLCKWLAGMLIIGIWGMELILNRQFNLNQIKLYTAGILAAFLIFLPWQIYAYSKFPNEYMYELSYNAKHIFEVVEGHSGGLNYYIERLPFQYPNGLYMFTLAGLILSFVLKIKNRATIFLFVIIPYVFFSLIAKSKLPSFVYFISLGMYFYIGVLIHFILLKSKEITNTKSLIIITCILLSIFNLNLRDILILHQKKANTKNIMVADRNNKRFNHEIFKSFNNVIPEGTVLYNVKASEEIEAMFYCDRNIFSYCPTKEEYDFLRKKNIKIMAVKSHGKQIIPDYMINDSTVTILDIEFK